MRLWVMAEGRFLKADLAHFPRPANWRKATRNMIMAAASIERALTQVPRLKVAANDDVALVLGTSSGELETSAEFMTTWSLSRLARPVLFQNSLHNATTGFAAIHFQLTGPSFTVSAMENTPSECIQLARSLMEAGLCSICVVTLAEAHLSLAVRIGESEVEEGALTVVLAAEGVARAMRAQGSRALVELPGALDYPTTAVPAPLVSINDSGLYRQIFTVAP